MTGATAGAPHVRDAANLRWAMNRVVIALAPCVVMAFYNTGLQANLALGSLKLDRAPGWQGSILDALGIGIAPTDFWAALWHGGLLFLPPLAVAMVVGALWQNLFARMRGRAVGEGGMLVALLFALSLPPSVPLWQVALGISFGVVVGKEIFGGTGRNFLNPALVGLAFLYVTYPQQMVSETAWIAVDGITGATNLRAVAEGGREAIAWTGTGWMQSFIGLVPGAFGATSTLACLIGAAVLVYYRVASLRVIAGVALGMVATALLFNAFGGGGPIADLSWHWHLVLGSFAFGMVYLATDPVSAAATDTGRWVYGLLIGALVVVIRVANPAHPDGVLFAILMGNIFAPLIDMLVVRAHIRRRARRHG